MSLVEVSFC